MASAQGRNDHTLSGEVVWDPKSNGHFVDEASDHSLLPNGSSDYAGPNLLQTDTSQSPSQNQDESSQSRNEPKFRHRSQTQSTRNFSRPSRSLRPSIDSTSQHSHELNQSVPLEMITPSTSMNSFVTSYTNISPSAHSHTLHQVLAPAQFPPNDATLSVANGRLRASAGPSQYPYVPPASETSQPIPPESSLPYHPSPQQSFPRSPSPPNSFSSPHSPPFASPQPAYSVQHSPRPYPPLQTALPKGNSPQSSGASSRGQFSLHYPDTLASPLNTSVDSHPSPSQERHETHKERDAIASYYFDSESHIPPLPPNSSNQYHNTTNDISTGSNQYSSNDEVEDPALKPSKRASKWKSIFSARGKRKSKTSDIDHGDVNSLESHSHASRSSDRVPSPTPAIMLSPAVPSSVGVDEEWNRRAREEEVRRYYQAKVEAERQREAQEILHNASIPSPRPLDSAFNPNNLSLGQTGGLRPSTSDGDLERLNFTNFSTLHNGNLGHERRTPSVASDLSALSYYSLPSDDRTLSSLPLSNTNRPTPNQTLLAPSVTFAKTKASFEFKPSKAISSSQMHQRHLSPHDQPPSQSILSPNDPSDCLQLGIEYHEKGELPRSAYFFERSAKERGGIGAGMLMWGLCLRHGWGCQINQELGFKFLQKAAETVVVNLDTVVKSGFGEEALNEKEFKAKTAKVSLAACI